MWNWDSIFYFFDDMSEGLYIHDIILNY